MEILATSNKEIYRFRRNGDENYLTTLNDLGSKISDVLTSLAAIPDKINALNDSYNSLDTYLDDLEEAALGELSYLSKCLSIFILDEDVYKPYPCLCESNDVYNLRAIRCFNDPAIECESCSKSVCGSWSQWSSWSVCSKSCGTGKRSRNRTFTWYDGRTFVEIETYSCNLEVCPHWGTWKPWSPCSRPCYEDGKPKPIQNRYRCWTINGVEDCGSGSGHAHYDYGERTCNTNNKCVAVCEWSNWGQWSACNPDCKKGYRIQRRTNNEDSEGASCIGVSLRTELCGDNADDECEECFDKYDKCNKISTSFCTDVRYAARMKSLCHKHCGCESRKRRSNDDVSILNENDHDAIQSIEFLALAMIKDSPRELSSFENDSRLRRSADLEDLNEVYSTIVERFEEVDVLLEGKV